MTCMTGGGYFACFLLHFVRSRSRNEAAQYTGHGVLFYGIPVGAEKRRVFIVADSTGKIPNPAIVKILYDFVYQCVRTNVTRVTA